MAEQVNQRIEDMINELEQMQRTNLYDEEEIREISRKRKEFEYKIQRRVKQKEDFVHYIAYELALIEDISLRRKRAQLGEKKNDIEYAIAKRLNRLFKQFIMRFKSVEIYFEYIKFCRAVGFDHSIPAIIGKMLQIHGDKPKVWQLASKWEYKELNNIQNARAYLLGGIKRHPESDILYLDMFELELAHAVKAEDEDEKEKALRRADVAWKHGVKNNSDVGFLFKLCDLSEKNGVESITKEIKEAIWARRSEKEVWSFIASKELQGSHWKEIEEFIDDDDPCFPKEINSVIAIFEEALQQFPDKKLCTKYIHTLLGASESICSDLQKIEAVKRAWMYGHQNGLLSNEMYAFGIEMLKLENEVSEEKLWEILDVASKQNPDSKLIWEEKLNLCQTDEKKSLSILYEASKVLKQNDALHLWNLVLERIDTKDVLQKFYYKFQNCESYIVLALKAKLLNKMNDISGLKAARELYEELIRTPPTQFEVHNIMINIEKSQDRPNARNIRKCYECAVQHHGMENVEVWSNYMKFELEIGNASLAPAIYRRAIGSLKKELVDEFIKEQTLAKLK